MLILRNRKGFSGGYKRGKERKATGKNIIAAWFVVAFFCVGIFAAFGVFPPLAQSAGHTPDLRARADSWPSSVPGGVSSSFNYTIFNDGANSTDAFNVGFFVKPSSSTTWPSTPTLFNTHGVPPSGGSVQGTISWTPTACGETFDVRIEANWDDAVIEDNKNNNYAPSASGMQVTVTCPNLTVSTTGWTSTAYFYQHQEFPVTISNTGDAFTGNFNVRLYVKEGSSGVWELHDQRDMSEADLAVIQNGEDVLFRIAAGGPTPDGGGCGTAGSEGAIDFSDNQLCMKAPRTCGTRYVKVIVDEDGDIFESNENDNVYPSASGAQVDVPCECTTPANFQASDITRSSIKWTWSGGSCGTIQVLEGSVRLDETSNTGSYILQGDLCGSGDPLTLYDDVTTACFGSDRVDPGTQYCLKIRNADFTGWPVAGSKRSYNTSEVCATTLPACGDNAASKNSSNIEGDDFSGPDCANGAPGIWGITVGDALNSSCWNNLCCGDDSNEYPSRCVTSTGSVSWNCGSYEYSCLKTSAFCVYKDIYTSAKSTAANPIPDSAVRVFNSGNDQVVWCSSAHIGGVDHWEDCDEGASFSDSQCGNFGKWLKAGEANVGEYDSFSGLVGEFYQFCGDDDNEYIGNLCPGVNIEQRCCNSASDKIDYTGSCVATCDTTVPTINSFTVDGKTHLQDPVRNTSGSVAVAWTASDAGVGLKRAEIWRAPYENNGGADCDENDKSGCSWGTSPIYTETANPGNASYTDTPGDGKWWYGLHVIDNHENCITESGEDCGGNTVAGASVFGPILAVVDGAAPSVTFTPASRGWDPTDISVQVTVADGTAGVDSGSLKYCWVEDGVGTSCTPGSSFASGSFLTQTQNGTWTLCVNAKDLNGNTASPCTGFYNKDNLAPSVDALAVDNFAVGAIVNAPGQPQVSWTVSDQADLSGVAYVKVRRGSGACSSAALSDITGQLSPGTGNSGSYTDTSISADGNYCYGLLVADNAGNTATEQAVQRVDVLVDTEAPNILFSGPDKAKWYSSVAVTVSLNDNNTVDNGVDFQRHCWVDAASGSTTCDPGTTAASTFQNNASVTQTQTGRWYVCVKGRDGALNWNDPSVCDGEYKIDKTPPTATGSADGSAQCEKVTFTITGASDAHSGLNLPNAYSFDNGNTWESNTSKTIDVVGGGTVTRTLQVRDQAGNVWSQDVTATTQDCDATPPDITFDIASRPWTNASADVVVTASDTASKVAYVRSCWTEAGTATTCDPGTTEANTSPFACDGTAAQCSATVSQTQSGSWYLCVRAANNGFTKEWTTPAECRGPYQVDVTDPAATFGAAGKNNPPAECEEITWSITGAADSHSGLDPSPYSFDNGTTWRTGSTFTETVSGGGTVTRTLKVRDRAGNELSSGTLSATTASCNIAPDVPTNLWQSPGAPGATTNDNTPYFTYTISDPNSGDTVGYQIQIASDSSFTSVVIDYTWDGSTINPNNVRYDVPSSCPTGSGYATCTAPLPDGTYWWRVRTKDGGGLTSAWASLASGFTVDTAGPTVGVSGAPASWQNTDATANVTCTDAGAGCDSGSYRLKEYVSSGTCSTTYADYTITPPVTVSGRTYYCAAAKDAAGNAGFTSQTQEFLVEKEKPSLSLTGVPASWQNTSASVGISCTDSGGSGCDSGSYQMYISASQIADCAAVALSSYTSSPPTSISSHQWACGTGTDTAGNRSFTSPAEILVDPTAPSASFSADGGQCEQITWTISGASDSGGSGLDPSPYSFDNGTTWRTGSTFTETVSGGGTVTRTLKVRDRAGNELSSGTLSATTASCNIAPDVPTNLWQSPGAPGATTNDNTPYFTYTISDPNSGDTVGYQIQIASDSSFTSVVIDYTWDGSTINPNNVRYDVPSSCPTGSGYATCTAPLPDGTYWWRVRTKDGGGLTSAWASLASGFTVDTAPPLQPSCSPAPGNYTSAVNVSLSSSGSSQIRYNIDTTAPADCASGTQYSGPISVSSSATINSVACDAAGNMSSSQSCAYNIGSVPNTTVESGPQDPSASASATFTFSGTNSPSGFECRMDSGAWASCASPKTYSGLTQGSHTFEVRGSNSFGTDGTPASYTWLIDLTDPSVDSFTVDGKGVSQSPLSTTNSSVPIAWSVSDSGGSGLKQVEVWRASGACATADWGNASIETVTIDSTYPGPATHSGSVTQTLADGTYCYGLHAVDHAGRWSDEGPLGPIEITVDTNVAPDAPYNLSQSPGTEGSVTGDNTPSFDFTISDPNSGDTVGYQIQIASDSGFTSVVIDYTWGGSTTNPNAVTYTVPGSSALSDGTYWWRVRAKDQKNAYSSWVEFGAAGVADFTVDTSVPSDPACSPAPGSYAGSASVSLSSSGDIIRYTIDSAAPASCSDGIAYSGPISVTSSSVIRSIACKSSTGTMSGVSTCSYTIGNVPETVIDSCAPDPTNSTSATLQFSGTESPTGYRCRLDASANQNTTSEECASPKQYTGLNEGKRIFFVKAYNDFGEDSTEASCEWLIDARYPDVDTTGSQKGFSVDGKIVSDSPFTTPDSSLQIGWDVTDSGGSGLKQVEVWRASGACATADWGNASIETVTIDSTYPGPATHSGSVTQTLAEGTYCFGLHVVDYAGNCLTEKGEDCSSGSAVANRPTVGPIEVTIDQNNAPNAPTNLFQSPGLEGAGTNDNTPFFEFRISDPNGGDVVGYQIQIADDSGFANNLIDYTWDGSTINPNNVRYDVPSSCPTGSGYATCTAPLPDGTYWWRVRAKDGGGLTSAWVQFEGAGADFWVDTVAPPKPTCTPGSQNFIGSIDVSCTDAEADAKIWYTVNGGVAQQYTGVLTFTQTTDLVVWAEDSVGNLSAAPNNSYTYTKGDTPDTSIDPPTPSHPTNSPNATLSFSGTNNPTGFTYRLDSGANQSTSWTTCGADCSPVSFTALNEGERTFSVYATNSFGDDSASPARYTWLIDLTDPWLNTDINGDPTFKVDGKTVAQSGFTTSNTSPAIEWNVSDGGGSGLKQVEVWRYAGTCADADAAGWSGANLYIETVTVGTAYPGPGTHSGSVTQALTDGATYCYGLHVIDLASNWTDEGTQGPIQVTVDSSAAPYFNVWAESPTTKTVSPGQSATFTIRVDGYNGYTGTVSFSEAWSPSQPSGTSASFAPASCSVPCSTTMTVSTSGTTPNSSSTITVTGSDGSATDSDSVTLNVTTTNVSPSAPKVCPPDALSNCNTY